MKSMLRRQPTAAQWNGVMWTAAIALVITTLLGAWWMAKAAEVGNTSTMLLRFVLTIALATYYYVWFNNARSARENSRMIRAIQSKEFRAANPTAEDLIGQSQPQSPPLK